MDWWNLGPVALMINSLVSLAANLGGSFGAAIIVLTIIVRCIMLPLTIRQLRSSRAMQSLQPKMAELQKKYAKDRQKLAEEQMKLYKESGVSPAGCAVPMLIQFPIWIALYQSIIKALGVTPEDLLGLSRFLWNWPDIFTTLPLDSHFLWFNLVGSDIGVAVLVGVSMWLSQKMVTPQSSDAQQKAQGQMMLWMMPLLFGFIAMSLPSGLAVYWIVSNVFSIVTQYFVIGGWGGLSRGGGGTSGRDLHRRVIQAESKITDDQETRKGGQEQPTRKESVDEGEYGVKRQLRGGGYKDSLKSIRRDSGKGKGHSK